jgi:hypothetical protein
MKSICIRCGAAKKLPWNKCRRCSFLPKDDDLVKSVYCSIGRFDEPDDAADYEKELEEMSSALARGEPIVYDEAELERLREQRRLVGSVRGPDLLLALFRIFLPAILFIAVMLLLIMLFKK